MFLDVNDEYLGGIARWGRLNFDIPRISVRELIRERVRLELERLQETRRARPKAVELMPVECRLNDPPRPQTISGLLVDGTRHDDPSIDRHVALAEGGFTRGRYYILVDNRQAESLDEEVELAATAEVTFLLLTPLKGG
jgi:hypothetical protein